MAKIIAESCFTQDGFDESIGGTGIIPAGQIVRQLEGGTFFITEWELNQEGKLEAIPREISYLKHKDILADFVDIRED